MKQLTTCSCLVAMAMCRAVRPWQSAMMPELKGSRYSWCSSISFCSASSVASSVSPDSRPISATDSSASREWNIAITGQVGSSGVEYPLSLPTHSSAPLTHTDTHGHTNRHALYYTRTHFHKRDVATGDCRPYDAGVTFLTNDSGVK